MNAYRLGRGGVMLLAGLLACGDVVSIAAEEQRKNFVSCPIIRDTASVPCWLAEYEGELYFLTVQSDVTSPVTPPWLGAPRARCIVHHDAARGRTLQPHIRAAASSRPE